jgi:hypothetical protein
MRDEAPLYYNEKYDFYALSRFADVEKGLVDRYNARPRSRKQAVGAREAKAAALEGHLVVGEPQPRE